MVILMLVLVMMLMLVIMLMLVMLMLMLVMMKMEENIIAIGITPKVSRLMQKKATQKSLIGQSLK